MSDQTKKILFLAVVCPAVFVLFLILGAYWTFPYDHLRDYIIQEAERGEGVQLEIAELEPSWVTGVDLEGVRVLTMGDDPSQPPAETVLTSAHARVGLISLIGGTTELTYSAVVDGGGTLEGEFAQNEQMMRVVADIQRVDLRKVGAIRDAVGLPVAGVLTGNVDLTIAAEAENTVGNANLRIANMSIADGRTPLVIPGLGTGLTLERMHLGNLELRMNVERGAGQIERLRADGDHAQLMGTGTVRLARDPRLSSLDLLVRVKLKDAYRESSPRMAGLMGLLEMNPAVRPARTPDGSLQWRIQGSPASRVRMIPSGRAPMAGAN